MEPVAVRKAPPPRDLPVTPASNALFRLGERCDHRCPMCSNTGDPALWGLSREEALARVQHLADSGFRRVVLTGGEPTIHRAFWEIVEALRDRGMVWDVNTNGGRFAEPGFAARARELGLQRAILSLHSHEEATSRLMSGLREGGHERILAGGDAILETGAELMLNLVLARGNITLLDDYLRFVHDRWGARPQIKLSFPNMVGKGGAWEDIQLSFEEVGEPVRRAMQTAAKLGIRLLLESFPVCVHRDWQRTNVGRSGFGETHYLDDKDGRTLYGMTFLEAMVGLYGPECQQCLVAHRCPGVPSGYVRRYGMPALHPLRPRS